MTTTLTIDECREECFRTSACNFWTYNRAGQKCYLKTKRGEPAVDTKYISGLKNCTGPKHFLGTTWFVTSLSCQPRAGTEQMIQFFLFKEDTKVRWYRPNLFRRQFFMSAVPNLFPLSGPHGACVLIWYPTIMSLRLTSALKNNVRRIFKTANTKNFLDDWKDNQKTIL